MSVADSVLLRKCPVAPTTLRTSPWGHHHSSCPVPSLALLPPLAPGGPSCWPRLDHPLAPGPPDSSPCWPLPGFALALAMVLRLHSCFLPTRMETRDGRGCHLL